MGHEQISEKQFFLLVYLYILGSSILYAPAIVTSQAKQDGWIAIIIATILGVVYAFSIAYFQSRFPSLTLLDISEKVVGKWVGKVLIALFIFYFYILASLLLRSIGDFVVTHILHETPIHVVMSLFILVSVFAVRYGLEVVGRTAEIFSPWVFGLFFIAILAVLPLLKFNNILPVFEQGMVPILQSSLTIFGFPFTEIFAFFFLAANQIKTKQLKRVFSLSVIAGGISLFIPVISTILVLGVDITSRSTFPTYTLAKKLTLGQAMEHTEVILAIIWFLTMFFQLTLILYVCTLCVSKLVNGSNNKVYSFPVAFLIVPSSILLGSNISYLSDFTGRYWVFYSISIAIIIPMLLYVGMIMKQKVQSN
jgi:spore germination protein KB